MAKIGRNLKALLNQEHLKEKEIKNTQDYALRFLDDLYLTIKKINMQELKTSSKTFKPSSMKCPRNMQFQVMGVQPEPEIVNPSLVRIGESGTDAHLRIQHWIAKMKDIGIDCEYINVADFVRSRNLTDLEIIKEPTEQEMETKLYNKKYNISFMCDGLIRYLGRYFIFEFKTETTHKNSIRTSYNEEHTAQICAYYLSFQIPDILMIYENRDTCSHKAYIVTVDDKMVWENVLSKIEEVNSCIQLGTLATAKRGKECQYCLYSKRCKQSGDSIVYEGKI